MPKVANIKLLPNCSHRAKTRECVDSRATHKLFDYSDPRFNETIVWTHRGCVCNELNALQGRHQLDTGARYTAQSQVFKNLEALVIHNGGFSELIRSSYSTVISHYSGAKRRAYEAARASLLVEPFDCCKDSRVRMFLKDDKYHTEEFKSPRCIQFRSKRYGLALSSYLQPVEALVYELVDELHTPVFAKSHNLDRRAQSLRSKWDSFVDPIAVCLDHSKFDCHVSVQLLEQEHAFYRQFYPGDAFLAKLLRAQLNNRGNTKNGTQFKTKGTRMSGDPNTGLGNSLINYGMLKQAFNNVRAGYYIDGDDSVVILERSELGLVDLTWFSRFGMNTKMEVVDEFEKVDFCQCRPVFDGVAWHSVRDPYRTLARLPWVVKRAHTQCASRYIKSVGMCELACNGGIPVLQSIASSMIRFGSGRYMKTDRHYLAKISKIKPWNAREFPIREVTRESFYKAWDITPEQQVAMEQMSLMRPEIDVKPMLDDILPPGVTYCEYGST